MYSQNKNYEAKNYPHALSVLFMIILNLGIIMNNADVHRATSLVIIVYVSIVLRLQDTLFPYLNSSAIKNAFIIKVLDTEMIVA